MTETGNKPVWPGWKTEETLGQGTYGAVYRIERDLFGTKEQAALKVISITEGYTLRNDGYDNATIASALKDRMEQISGEYLLMKKMNGSANIVNCDDILMETRPDGMGVDVLIKMELLTPLGDALPKGDGEIPETMAVRLGVDMARALVLCGKNNIIHRDIKPANIFLSPNGDYKLGDFGVARTMENTMSATRTGTFDYMPPEVYNNLPYGAQADIYSLGLVLYWMMNERRTPFLPPPPAIPKLAEKQTALMRRMNGDPLPEPLHGSPELKQIILKACAYKVEDRYRTAEEFLRDMEALAQKTGAVTLGRESSASVHSGKTAAPGQIVAAARKSPQKSGKSGKKGRLAATAAAVMVLAGAFLLGGKKEKAAPKPAAAAETPAAAKPAAETKAGLQVGDTCYLGCYEQDNDLKNGMEPIRWRVLEIRDGKSLLISEYGLINREFYHEAERTTWAESDLRIWLNDTFFRTAFAEEEQKRIISLMVPAAPNPKYDTDPASETSDRVFLLSISEAERCLPENADRVCAPTEYAKANGAFTDSGACWWWLRTPGDVSYRAAYVRTDGRISYEGHDVRGGGTFEGADCVRPAIWISYSDNDIDTLKTAPASRPSVEVTPAPTLTQEPLSVLPAGKVGDYVTLGRYEQDGDETNGPEPIEWQILTVEGGKGLLISTYALDMKPYHPDETEITWEDCSLREWLNSEFLNTAFTVQEQERLVFFVPEENVGGSAEQVTLLNFEEVERYFPNSNDRICALTAAKEPRWNNIVGLDNIECWWWLRTNVVKDIKYNCCGADFIGNGEDHLFFTSSATIDFGWVRPAIWITLE